MKTCYYHAINNSYKQGLYRIETNAETNKNCNQ